MHVKLPASTASQQAAMQPIVDRQHQGAVLSRIKVMAELDIAEKRIPQDGRFRLRMPGKTVDFRVSIMAPACMARTPVIRILDKQSISEQFSELTLDIVGFGEDELRRFRRYIGEAVRNGPGDRADREREDDHAVRGAVGDQLAGGQDRHHRGSGGVTS